MSRYKQIVLSKAVYLWLNTMNSNSALFSKCRHLIPLDGYVYARQSKRITAHIFVPVECSRRCSYTCWNNANDQCEPLHLESTLGLVWVQYFSLFFLFVQVAKHHVGHFLLYLVITSFKLVRQALIISEIITDSFSNNISSLPPALN